MELMNWIFFGPSKLIGWLPYAGFAIAALLLASAAADIILAGTPFTRQWFRRPAVLAGLLWLLFNLYELQLVAVFAQHEDQVRSLFRIDLLVLAPILYVLTGLAIYQFWRTVFRQPG